MSVSQRARHVTRKGAMAAALLLAGGVGLAGCVNLGKVQPPQHLLRLSAEVMAPAGPLAAAGQVLVVREPEADRSLTLPRLAVQVSASEIAYMQGGAWVERPTRQFRALLAETLRAKGRRLVIEDDGETPRAAPRLEGRLLALGYDARTRAVVVRYDALLQTGEGITAHRFEAVQTGVAPKIEAVAPVLNRLANKVAADVAAWAAMAPATTMP